MAIKLEVYLKRTQQSLREWLSHNDITRIDDLVPRAKYLGFEVGRAEIVEAERIFKEPVVIDDAVILQGTRDDVDKSLAAAAASAARAAVDGLVSDRPETSESPEVANETTPAKKPRRKATETIDNE